VLIDFWATGALLQSDARRRETSEEFEKDGSHCSGRQHGRAAPKVKKYLKPRRVLLKMIPREIRRSPPFATPKVYPFYTLVIERDGSRAYNAELEEKEPAPPAGQSRPGYLSYAPPA